MNDEVEKLNTKELFRLASLIGCEPEDEERHRKDLLSFIQTAQVEAVRAELETMQVIDFEPDEQGEIEYMTLDEYLVDRIKELNKEDGETE